MSLSVVSRIIVIRRDNDVLLLAGIRRWEFRDVPGKPHFRTGSRPISPPLEALWVERDRNALNMASVVTDVTQPRPLLLRRSVGRSVAAPPSGRRYITRHNFRCFRSFRDDVTGRTVPRTTVRRGISVAQRCACAKLGSLVTVWKLLRSLLILLLLKRFG